jgi:pyocin large subunit-like protein
MSNRAITWALKTELSTTPKFVLVVLADLADEEHSCYPGQEYLARAVGASDRTVRRSLIDLESWGYLHRVMRRTEDGYRTSDRYFLHVDKPVQTHRPK